MVYSYYIALVDKYTTLLTLISVLAAIFLSGSIDPLCPEGPFCRDPWLHVPATKLQYRRGPIEFRLGGLPVGLLFELNEGQERQGQKVLYSLITRSRGKPSRSMLNTSPRCQSCGTFQLQFQSSKPTINRLDDFVVGQSFTGRLG